MSDIFVDLARRYAIKEVTCVNDVVHHIRDGLVAAAVAITYQVSVGGEEIWVLPGGGLTFLVDVAVPYVEAVFFRMPFLGTVSYNAQARQISPDISDFKYGALYADPIPTWGPAFHRACACRTCIAICRTSSAAGMTPTDEARPTCMCRSASVSRSRCLRQRRHRRHHAASIGYRRS